jgi:hypothetical protein
MGPIFQPGISDPRFGYEIFLYPAAGHSRLIVKKKDLPVA